MKPNRKIIPTSLLSALCLIALTGFGFQQQSTGTDLSSSGNNSTINIQSNISGVVRGAGSPIAGSLVTIYVAGPGAPRQLDQTKSGTDGTFKLNPGPSQEGDVLYITAAGGIPDASGTGNPNDNILLISVLGSQPPPYIVINEMTTIASVWTCTQFLNNDQLSGTKLGLSIAAGNVPNFVSLETGGYGTAIQSPLNSSQNPDNGKFCFAGEHNLRMCNADNSGCV